MEMLLGGIFAPVAVKNNVQQEQREQREPGRQPGKNFRQRPHGADALQSTEAERLTRRCREEEEAQRRHDRARRQSELQCKIEALRLRLEKGGEDHAAITAELELAKTQLYWVTNSM